MNARPFLIALNAALVLAACSSDAPSTTRPPEPLPPVSAAPAARAPTAVPSPHSTDSAKSAAQGTLPASHPPIDMPKALGFTAPDGWVGETPTSAVRKAQYKLPRHGSDSEDAKVVVFFFGGEGGGIEDNLQRWAREYEQPDGSPSMDALKRATRKVNGMDVTEVDVGGIFVAETQPGSGQRVRKESWRTLAAIVQSDHGSYYVKLVGPVATVAHWEPSFRQFVSSAAPK